MNYFISSRPNPNAEGDDELRLLVTNSYVELNFKIDDSTYIVVYLIFKSSNSVFVVTCWDDTFDTIIENIENEDYFETLQDTWPNLTTLFVNGVNDKYSNGALIKLEDSDNGDIKWFVASIAGNIGFDSLDDLLCERTFSVISLVIEKSIALTKELNEKEPSILRAIGRGVVKGALLAVIESLF